jgi:hypothetical protein
VYGTVVTDAESASANGTATTRKIRNALKEVIKFDNPACLGPAAIGTSRFHRSAEKRQLNPPPTLNLSARVDAERYRSTSPSALRACTSLALIYAGLGREADARATGRIRLF